MLTLNVLLEKHISTFLKKPVFGKLMFYQFVKFVKVLNLKRPQMCKMKVCVWELSTKVTEGDKNIAINFHHHKKADFVSKTIFQW